MENDNRISENLLKDNEEEIIEPLFKFLTAKWANALIMEGNVQLCYTNEFRKDKY